MKFFNIFEKAQISQEVSEEEGWKNRIKKIFEARKHISMEPVPADRPIQDKLDLDEANLIDEMGRDKYDELLEQVEEEFGQDVKSI